MIMEMTDFQAFIPCRSPTSESRLLDLPLLPKQKQFQGDFDAASVVTFPRCAYLSPIMGRAVREKGQGPLSFFKCKQLCVHYLRKWQWSGSLQWPFVPSVTGQ